ncbi:MAG: hypothetical protein M9941_00130 [Anaerolineae bacterium]|nr:hypothetical protein [Anaerolineae bacterium]MCO5196163.1 hypothetical protein [Anaerolineae bacterium]
MIRPFQLPDFNLLHRLDRHKIPLNAEAALTRQSHSLWNALRDMVGSGEAPTFIWKSDENDAVGFVQLLINETKTQAHLLYMGSADNGADTDLPINEDIWLAMLDQTMVEVGKLGVLSVVAEAPENGPELPILRRAGFAVYTRQDIWVHNGFVAPVTARQAISVAGREDERDIELLYAHTVPQMIQLVEPRPPLDGEDKWVLRESGELMTYAHLQRGSDASWMRLFVHPNVAAPLDDFVGTILNERPPTQNRPIFCRLRRSQQWVESALQANGFEYWGSQAVMVKHIVQHIKKPLRPLESYMQEESATARSTPLAQKYERDDHEHTTLTT